MLNTTTKQNKCVYWVEILIEVHRPTAGSFLYLSSLVVLVEVPDPAAIKYDYKTLCVGIPNVQNVKKDNSLQKKSKQYCLWKELTCELTFSVYIIQITQTLWLWVHSFIWW